MIYPRTIPVHGFIHGTIEIKPPVLP